MRLLLLPLPGNEKMCDALEGALGHFVPNPPGRETVAFRRFPDGESYVRIKTPIAGRAAAIFCTLDRPDDKVLPLIFLAETARQLGAASVGLIAPYLAYMRQDRRFIDGEGVTSAYFAALLSRAVDWLVTVDPHLHRRTSLSEIYSIPTEVVHAAPRVAEWISSNVQRPLLIGPDEESAQWVAAVAGAAGAPSVALQKVRRGDRDVSVTVPDLRRWRDRTPVLVDDIVSTARTMIETVRHLQLGGRAAPVCVAVHPVFVAGAYDELRQAGAARIVSCNTIPHPSNAIDLSGELARAVDTRHGAVVRRRPG